MRVKLSEKVGQTSPKSTPPGIAIKNWQTIADAIAEQRRRNQGSLYSQSIGLPISPNGVGSLPGVPNFQGMPKPASMMGQGFSRSLPSDDPRIQGRPSLTTQVGQTPSPRGALDGKPAPEVGLPAATGPQSPRWAGQDQPAGAKDPKFPSEGDRIKGYGMNQAMNYGPRLVTEGAQAANLIPSASSSLSSAAPAALSGGESILPAGWNAYNSVVSGLAPEAAAGASAATTGTSLGAMASQALPWLGLAGQGYAYVTQGYDAAKGLTDSTAANDAGSAIKAGLLATGPLAGWAAPLVDVVGIKSGKHEDQYQRDAIVKHLRDKKFLDEKNTIGLAGGGRFDLGDETIAGLGTKDDKSYNINWEDPRVAETVGAIQPLVDILIGNKSDKRTGDLTGKLVNAALSSGDMSEDSIRGFYEQAGFDRESVAAAINDLAKDAERLTPERRDAYLAAIDKLLPGGAKEAMAAEGKKEPKGGGKSKPKKKEQTTSTPFTPAYVPPVAPIPGAPTNFGQAIAATNQNNTSAPINAQLNPVTQSPFTMRRIQRRV